MASSRQIELAAATWLARRDVGDWSVAEQDALDAWLAESTAHRVAFLRLDSAWREAGRLQALGAGLAGDEVPARGRWTQPAAAEDVFVVSRMRRRAAQASMPWRWLGAAVAALVLALVGTAAWYHAGNEPLATYATAVGQLSEVPLTDGSHATLSSDSQVQVAWSRGERHIDLMHGEAFFAVAKNPGRPFVVQAGGRQVVAVGTRFSVRRDGSRLRVVVTEGVVRLEPADADGGGSSSTLLPAGSVALMDGSGLLVRSLPVAQAEHYLDWRSGYVSFHNTPLATAVSEMNRYNARKIVVADPAIAGIPLGGNFRWSNTDAFVNLLVAGFPVRAEPRGDQVLLYAR
ncbi:FecR family protein [Luteibacter sp.]|jgi:transmembrane sensor|uniref:FecR family protein n=1 Tax=Luteibacter sp. TaxID=1886636 RepID=UPI002F3EBFD8